MADPPNRFGSDGSDMVFEGDPRFEEVSKRIAEQEKWRRENGPRLLREAQERLAAKKAAEGSGE
jgi:hypothetical protein